MNKTIKELIKYKTVNNLKSIYRSNHVNKRQESSAEHSWGTLLLADYYLNKIENASKLKNKTNNKQTDKKNSKLDRTKIYELLMYHDLIEIYAGDTPLNPNTDDRGDAKFIKEEKAAKQLRNELPKEISEKFYNLFIEFEETKTPEAKFCKAIDAFEAQIHEIDYKKDWKGWTKEFLLKSKLNCFEDFPEIKKDFLDLCKYLEKEGYFSQK